MRRPAIRIILGPIQRFKNRAEGELFLHGMVPAPRTILIDPRSADVVATFIHERLHMDHPSWTEKEVRAEEKRLVPKLTWKQRAEILRLIGQANILGSKELEELLS